MILVFKFGGSSLINGKTIKHVAKLVADYLKKEKLIIVVSALKGITNQLIENSERAEKGDIEFIKRFVEDVRKRHLEAAEGAIEDRAIREEVSKAVKELVDELERVLLGVIYVRELTPRTKDRILSFGERLCAPIFAGALKSLGFDARSLTGQEAGIVTDDSFGEAIPLMEVTKYEVRKRIDPLIDRGIVPVITGYIAATQEGITTTLGRGGSDYTATIIASALGADEAWIWTDSDGLMTADPEIVSSAKVLPEVSFSEAAEMAVFGAKYMHPRALDPAMETNIPVRIKNAFNPEAEGTLIVKESKMRPGEVVKSVSIVRDVALVNVSGFGMIGRPGTAARVFDLMGKNGINIFMISQSVSEANISFIIRRDLAEKACSILETALLGRGIVRDVSIEDDICVVAVIGAGMRGTPGIAARVFSAVARKGVNVRMIAQGSSELNISFVVKEVDGETAVRAIHEEFSLDKL